ncbi:MAG TPA: hypothetical protein VFU16_13230 [Solirubrobacterales bacterium]|nr:hypothetical protein [Solirubrobacterales bacterium]
MAKGARLRFLVYLLSGVALAGVAMGCGEDAEGETSADAGETRVLSATETKQLLHQLTYRYKFRQVATPEGAEAAVAGRVFGPHHTVLNFGVALGHGNHAVPVPRAGTAESYGYPRGGFIFTTDTFIKGSDGRLVPNPKLKTAAQWRQASDIEVKMTDKLCLAATGGHCPP